ncbi:MAG: peptidase family protein [Candidatus Saccharibacteria bacterium]|nr:peptidase family protein [Candidatus Saccharibacteria bacterium]
MFILLHVFVPIPYSSTPSVRTVIIVPTSPKVIKASAIVSALPVRLEITSINIDTTIYTAGLTSSGDMDISENPDEVAWYQFGPKPGEIGSAVIAGHYGWKDGHGSIFNNLHMLVKGDEVSVYDQKGVKKVFVVQATQIYNPDADATKVFVSTDKKAHLNLITCEGTWVNTKDSYSNRLVVFTDLK